MRLRVRSALPASALAQALTRLEAEGYVMRGRFTPGTTDEEWCERHLLARIHRYTVRRLRREIEPVDRHDFMRFLFAWQRVSADTRGAGRDALAAVLDQMEGFQAAAGAWEEDILPARLDDYSITSLDELCRSGKLVWTRLTERTRAASAPVRSTPVVLLPRRQVAVWSALLDPSKPPELSTRAQAVHDALANHGAMFFDELVSDVHLLPIELENALGELVAAGLVNSDSFAGLRALLKPVAKRHAFARSRRRGAGALIGGMDDAGRWALVRRRPAQAAGEAEAEAEAATIAARRPQLAPEVVEHVAMTLLRRYGVVFWRLLEREAEWLPPWRDLLRVYQRLEARGQVRGGRFVNGLARRAVRVARSDPAAARNASPCARWCLRLHRRYRSVESRRHLVAGRQGAGGCGQSRAVSRDGVPVATLASGEFAFLEDADGGAQEQMRACLARRR